MAKQSINLSKEALAALRLPVKAQSIGVTDSSGHPIFLTTTCSGTFDDDFEIAAALAQLINAAFTPDPVLADIAALTADDLRGQA